MKARKLIVSVVVAVAMSPAGNVEAQDCTARFNAPARHRVGSAPGPVIAWDFDGDGDQDLAAAASPEVSILTNAGVGSFGGGKVLADSRRATALVAADFDLDGRGDVLVVQRDVHRAGVFFGDGALLFTRQDVGAALDGASKDAAFLNADGRPDVVGMGADGSVMLLLSSGDGGFEPPVIVPAPPGSAGAAAVAAGDWDQDGLTDLAVAWTGKSSVDIYPASTLDRSSAKVAVPVPMSGPVAAFAAGDVDRDGRQDLVAALTGSASLVLARGQGDLALGAEAFDAGSAAKELQLLDVTGDRLLDLVVTAVAGGISVVSNADLLAGVGTHASSLAGVAAAARLAAADLDGDVAIDLAVPAAGSEDVAVCINSTRCLAVTGIRPREVSSQAGSLLGVYGSNLDDVDLFLDGSKLEVATRALPTAVTVRLPALEPGEYALEARDRTSGLALSVTAPTVAVVEARLPPVSEVDAVVIGPQDVKLSWTSVVDFDSITVTADGVKVADLPGDATTFTHHRSTPLEPGKNVAYEITGTGAAPDAPGRPIESWPSGVAVARPRPHRQLVPGATGLPGKQSLRLRGEGGGQIRTLLRLDESARGLELQVRARQRDSGATLVGLLTAATGTVEAIPITFRPEPSGPRGGWFTAATDGEIAAGEYILTLSVEDGDPRRAAFLVSADAGSETGGTTLARSKAPSQPLVLAYPRSRVEVPQVKLRELVLHPATASLLKPRGAGSGAAAGSTSVRAFKVELEEEPESDDFTPSYSWEVSGAKGLTFAGDTLSTFGRCGEVASVTTVAYDRSSSSSTPPVSDIANASIAEALYSVSRPEEGMPPDIAEVSPDPVCDGLAFLPDIATDANVTFRTRVIPAVGATIEQVRMYLVDADSGDHYIAKSASERTYDPSSVSLSPTPDSSSLDPTSYWEATLNMSDLPAVDEVVLQIRATDSKNKSTTFESRVTLCEKPSFLDLGFISSTIAFDEEDNEYTIEARFPPDPLFDKSITIPIINKTLDNVLDANVSTTLRLRRGDWYGDDLEGELTLTLLGIDLASKEWELGGDFDYLACPDFGFTWEKNDIQTIDAEKEIEILHDQLLAVVCAPPPFTFICVTIYASLSLTLGIEAPIDLALTFKQSSPYFELDACVHAEAFVEAQGSISGTAAYVLTFCGSIYPRITANLPTSVHYSPTSGLGVDSALCFTFSLDWSAELCVDLKLKRWCLDTGTKTFIDDAELGGGCDEDPCGSGGGSGHAAGRGGGVVDQPSFTERAPSIATSPDGKTSLMVFVKNTAPDPGELTPELYYAVDTGGGWSTPLAVRPPRGAHDERDPQVVFTSNTDAVLVWTTNVLSQAQVEALPDTVSGINQYMAGFEISFSRWNVARGWSPAQLLAENPTLDAKPRLAAVPNRPDAWVAWVRFEGDFLTANGEVNGGAASVFARQLMAGGPLGAVVNVSADGAGLPDHEPVLAIERAIPPVPHLYWLRDEADGSRSLLHASFAGGWSAPERLLGGPEYAGIDSPSAAFGPNGEGVVAFTAGAAVPHGALNLSFEEHVYAARFAGGELGTPVAVREGDGGEGLARGRDPQAMYLDGSTFAVGFRAFAGQSARSRLDGEAALATIDFGAGARQQLRLLTDDDETNLEVHFAPDARGRIRTVWNRPGPGAVASLGDDLVAVDFVRGADARLETLRLPDANAPPGSEVTLTALIRNMGLNAPGAGGGGAASVLRVHKLTSGGSEEIAAVPVSFTAAPGAVQEVAVQLIAPEGGARLRAVLDPISGETNADDNAAEITTGVAAPASFTCTVMQLPAGPATFLAWQNAEPYDAVAIARDGALLARLGGGAEAFVDREASPGPHVWSLRGERRGASSGLGAAVCAGTVPGGEVEPTFRRGDANGDGNVDISDAIGSLTFLFLGADPWPCIDAADANDDGQLDLSDAVATLGFLFLGSPPPPAPGPVTCGPDPNADDLGCASGTGCP